MLVKVDQSNETNFSNKSFMCSKYGQTNPKPSEKACKLHLITPNLVENNVGKILVSELTEITDATTQIPKDSYIILELTGTIDQSKTFENQEILVKYDDKIWLLCKFDKLLYKKQVTNDSETVDVLVPLKKNIHSFLIERQKALQFFQGQEEPKSFKCSFTNETNGSVYTARTNTDDSCKIIKIDLPEDNEKTIITLDAIKKSSSPFTKDNTTEESPLKWAKLEVDINKFYKSGIYDFSNENIEVANGSKKIELTISHSISDTEIQGEINWLIVKYKGEGGQVTMSVSSDVCSTYASIPSILNQKSCSIYELEGNQPNNKGDIEKVLINSEKVNDKKTLINGNFYAIQYTEGPNRNIFTDKDPFYLYTYKSTNAGKKTYDRHTFDLVALLTDKPTKENKSLMLSDIDSWSS